MIEQRFVIRLDRGARHWLEANRFPVEVAGLWVWLDGFVAEPATLATALGAECAAPAQLVGMAYRRWGDRLQAHVLGEYVAAIVDPGERRLFLTGDALGLRPVYWRRDGAELIAASDLATMVGMLDTVEVDDSYVAAHLLTARHDADATPYRGVRKLPPGHSLTVDRNGQARDRKTWQLAAACPALGAATPGALEERLRAELQRAMSAHLDVPHRTLAELSGGLDSSTIAAIAWTGRADVRPRALLSVIYDASGEADERAWMDALLDRYAYRSIRLDGDEHAPFSVFPSAFVAAPGTAISFAALARAYEAATEDEGADVVLSGNGGDHVLMGDAPPPLHLADDLAHGRWRTMLATARSWSAAGDRRSVGYHLTNHALRPLLARLTSRMVTPPELPPRPPWIAAELARSAAARAAAKATDAMRATQSIAQQQFVERLAGFSDTAGHNFQGNVTGFTYRYPLLFLPLVEMLSAVPLGRMIQPGVDRLLQRRALRDILPDAIRLRRGKRGPDAAVLRGLRANADWLDLLRDRPMLVANGYVDRGQWDRVVQIAAAGHMQLISLFLQAATLEYWFRNLTDRPRDMRSRLLPIGHRDGITPHEPAAP